jgi:hypothetical protein
MTETVAGALFYGFHASGEDLPFIEIRLMERSWLGRFRAQLLKIYSR